MKKKKSISFRPSNTSLTVLENYMKEHNLKSTSEAVNKIIEEHQQQKTVVFPTELNPADFKGVSPETVKELTQFMKTRMEYLRTYPKLKREKEAREWEELFS